MGVATASEAPLLLNITKCKIQRKGFFSAVSVYFEKQVHLIINCTNATHERDEAHVSDWFTVTHKAASKEDCVYSAVGQLKTEDADCIFFIKDETSPTLMDARYAQITRVSSRATM